MTKKLFATALFLAMATHAANAMNKEERGKEFDKKYKELLALTDEQHNKDITTIKLRASDAALCRELYAQNLSTEKRIDLIYQQRKLPKNYEPGATLSYMIFLACAEWTPGAAVQHRAHIEYRTEYDDELLARFPRGYGLFPQEK